MSLHIKIDDRFGRFAVPQLTLLLIIFQIVVYGVSTMAHMRSKSDASSCYCVEHLRNHEHVASARPTR